MRVCGNGGTGAIGGHVVHADAQAAGQAMWLRGPGRAALLFGDRLTSLARSLRVSNTRLRNAAGWAPRHPGARPGWLATAAALPRGG